VPGTGNKNILTFNMHYNNIVSYMKGKIMTKLRKTIFAISSIAMFLSAVALLLLHAKKKQRQRHYIKINRDNE